MPPREKLASHEHADVAHMHTHTTSKAIFAVLTLSNPPLVRCRIPHLESAVPELIVLILEQRTRME